MPLMFFLKTLDTGKLILGFDALLVETNSIDDLSPMIFSSTTAKHNYLTYLIVITLMESFSRDKTKRSRKTILDKYEIETQGLKSLTQLPKTKSSPWKTSVWQSTPPPKKQYNTTSEELA